MNNLRQIFAVTELGLSTLHTRIKASAVIVAGLACVVAVVLSILSIGEGLRLAILNAGDPDRALVLSLGAQQETGSTLPRAWAAIIKDAPGIAKANGAPLADAQLATNLHFIKKSNHTEGYTRLRGMGAAGFAMSPEFHLIAGRMFRPGRQELIAGATAREKFAGLEVGGKVKLPDGENWPVVGLFVTGTMLEGDVIGDPQTLMASLKRSSYTHMLVRLETPQAFAAFHNALTKNPALAVTVERESEFYRQMWQRVPNTPYITAFVLGLLLAMGAIAGTLNTMYSAVSARAQEIAILRALGFGGFPVAASVVLEAMLLASIGAAIGTFIDWCWLDGYAYNALGVFRVRVTLHLLLVATGWSLLIALIGALSPALQAARVTVVDALRAP